MASPRVHSDTLGLHSGKGSKNDGSIERQGIAIFALSKSLYEVIQTERKHRRLATIFLGLFLSLLSMVSLHDLSHRAEVVSGGVCTEAEGYTTQLTQADCSICHFIHTPFLALSLGTMLSALTLGVCVLGVCLVRLVLSIRRDAVQLRAPPTLC